MSKLQELITKSDMYPFATHEKDEYGVPVCTRLIAEITTALEATIDPLMRAAYSWGDEDSDSCGICHKHFADCEEDQLAVPINKTEADVDIPTGREYACAGARARRVLNRLPQLLNGGV